jgi:hypothetical protein
MASAKQRIPLAELLSDGIPMLMEGAVVERVRRGAPDLLDTLLMNAPLIYRKQTALYSTKSIGNT